MVKDEFLAKRGDVAAKLVRSIRRAVDAIYKDPQMTIAVASKNLPTVERPLLEEMIPHLLKADNPKAFATKITPEAIAAENEWLLKTKDIAQPIPYEKVVAKDMAKYW
jgi:ABC-type nitrate/sulfonate/bicarbonate transport system substrate-binding protein